MSFIYSDTYIDRHHFILSFFPLVFRLEVIWELEAIVDEVRILGKGRARLLEEIVHHTDRLLVGQLKLRIQHVHNVLDGLIRNYSL